MLPPRTLLLQAAFLIGLAHLLVLPPWQGEDEPWHVEYATLVARGHSPIGVDDLDPAETQAAAARGDLSVLMVARRFGQVPVAELRAVETEILESMRRHHFSRRVDWSGELTGATTFDAVARGFSAVHQPPPHYLLVGTLARWLGRTDAEGVLWTGRGVAVVSYLLMIAMALSTARALGLSPEAALLAGAVLTLWPMHARHAAVVNNDVMAKLLSSGALWLGALGLGGRLPARTALLAASTLAFAAAAAKSTGLPAAGAVVSVLALLRLSPRRRDLAEGHRPRLPWAAAVGVATIALAFLILVWADHAPVLPGSLQGVTDRLARAAAPSFWSHLATTFVGSWAWESRHAGAGVTLAALGGWALAARLGWRGLARGRVRGARLLIVVPLVAQVVAVALRGASAGRYLFPAILAFALLAGAAVDGVEGSERRRQVRLGLTTGLVALFAWCLWTGLIPAQHGRLGA